MSDSYTDPLQRPSYDLYDSQFHGNKIIYLFFSALSLFLTILLTIHLTDSLRLILQQGFIAQLTNILILIVEGLLGYYSIIYIVHFGRTYLSISTPLDPQIKREDMGTNRLPLVSVLMPIYKEPVTIVSQSLKAALELNYPKDRYEVVLIEDGRENDEIKNVCREIGVTYLTRDNRSGFKAGAVNVALPQLIGKFVVFIDADHVLHPNVIYNCLLNWRENTIAVQTRLDFVNIDSYFTLLSSYLQTQFFSLFQRARRSTGSAIFAGGAALFNRKLLIENGGMNELTIADDTDTSIIVICRGYRIEYIDTIGGWALVPWDPLHLMRQVWRWLTGITKGFKARFGTIVRSKQPLYVKLDFISLGIFPTIAVVGWLIGFFVVTLIINGEKFIRSDNILGNQQLNFLLLLIPLCPVFAGITVLFIQNDFLQYTQRSSFEKFKSISGFYLMVFAAQPMLIGAVTKGLFGFQVTFNRTPKINQVDDNRLRSLKRFYLMYTTIVFISGVILLTYALTIPIWDPRAIAVIFTAYSGMIPLIISVFWYSRLDDYLDQVGDISPLEIIQMNSIQN